jgi:hypothetical protein
MRRNAVITPRLPNARFRLQNVAVASQHKNRKKSERNSAFKERGAGAQGLSLQRSSSSIAGRLAGERRSLRQDDGRQGSKRAGADRGDMGLSSLSRLWHPVQLGFAVQVEYAVLVLSVNP